MSNKMTIEQYLDALAPYAFVRISQSDRDETWSAVADLRIRSEGGEFKIRSGFGCRTPADALDMLLERVIKVVVQAQNFQALEVLS